MTEIPEGYSQQSFRGYIAGHEPRILHEEILDELQKARRKFPEEGLWMMLSALTEEVGELNQACLQHHQEPEKGKTIDSIRKEAVQVAAMAMRVVLDTELKTPYGKGIW